MGFLTVPQVFSAFDASVLKVSTMQPKVNYSVELTIIAFGMALVSVQSFLESEQCTYCRGARSYPHPSCLKHLYHSPKRVHRDLLQWKNRQAESARGGSSPRPQVKRRHDLLTLMGKISHSFGAIYCFVVIT